MISDLCSLSQLYHGEKNPDSSLVHEGFIFYFYFIFFCFLVKRKKKKVKKESSSVLEFKSCHFLHLFWVQYGCWDCETILTIVNILEILQDLWNSVIVISSSSNNFFFFFPDGYRSNTKRNKRSQAPGHEVNRR